LSLLRQEAINSGATMTEVPLIVTEEAAARVAKLGLEGVLEQHLDWARHNVVNLHGIRVELQVDRRPEWERTLVIIRAHHRPPEEPPYHFIEWDWVDWMFQALPPEVRTLFHLRLTYHPLNKSA
jgi:hypothetical protein